MAVKDAAGEVCIPKDATGHALAVCVLLRHVQDGDAAKVKLSGQAVTMQSQSRQVEGVNTVCKQLCRQLAPDLLGRSAGETAQVLCHSCTLCAHCALHSARVACPVVHNICLELNTQTCHSAVTNTDLTGCLCVQIEQWLSFVHTQLTPVMDNQLVDVNAWLAARTYLVGARPTLADIVLYAALSTAVVRSASAKL